MRNHGCYFTLDVAHALSVTPEDEAIRYIELCHDRLVNVHLSRFDQGKAHFPLDRDASDGYDYGMLKGPPLYGQPYP